MPHEVLTLQFGEFANYVGAHYWNIQDEIFGLQGGPGKEHGAESQIASEVLYQERITPQSSFVPRLVIFNAKGSLGPVRAQAPPNIESALHPPNAAHTWSGHTEVHISPGVRKNKFQEELETESESNAPVIVADRDEEEEAATALELAAQALDAPGAVRYFTDFLKVPINARNLHLVEGLWHHGPGLQGWGQAGGLAHQAEERDAAAEKIRVLAEEADALSGFQCFIEDLSAWGSVSGQVLQDVRDDYGSGKAVLLFCTRRSTGGEAPQPSDLRRRRMCEALSTSLLSQHCDLYVPVQAPTRYSAFPALRWRQGDLFHESALCGVAVHGATLPYRLATGVADPALGGVDMWSLARLLTSQSGTPLSTLSMAFPCPSLPSDEQRASADADSRMQHGSSSQAPSFLTAATSVSWEGLGVVGDQNRYAECLVLQSPRAGGAAVPLSRASGMLDAALMRDDPLRCVRHRVLTAQPLPVPLPFPGLFASTVTRWGDVGSGAHGAGNGHHVDSCPILVRLAGSTAIGWEVRRLGQQFASAAGTAHGQAVLDGWGVDRDMREDVHERLASLAQAPLEELG